MFSRSSASQTLVKETNYDQFIISKDVMDKSVSNQSCQAVQMFYKIWHVIWLVAKSRCTIDRTLVKKLGKLRSSHLPWG